MYQTNTMLANIHLTVKLYDSMMRPLCSRYSLSPIEVTIISFLFNNPGVDTAADISSLRMLPKSNVSQAIESLIQKSLLQRRQDTEDRRRIHLSLTPQAESITKEIELVRESFQKQIFRGFAEEEKKQFIAFNDRIAENARTGMQTASLR